MDFGHDAYLSQERLATFESDADRFRLRGPAGGSSNPAVARDAARIGAVARRALGAVAGCRWDRADRALTELRKRELVPAAQLAVASLLAQLRGTAEEAGETISSLRHGMPPRSADPGVWATATIAAALHGYAGGTVDRSLQPVAIVRQVCGQASRLHPETMELLCFSLALLASAGQAPMLAAFLLGHLTDATGGFAGVASGEAGARLNRANPTRYAAAGLCMMGLGDVNGGYRLLMKVVDAESASRIPLVAGLVGAELARIELEHGTQGSPRPWLNRTRRFCRRYGCSLPMRALEAARAPLPDREAVYGS